MRRPNVVIRSGTVPFLLCVFALCERKNAHSYIGKYHAAAGRAAPEQVTMYIALLTRVTLRGGLEGLRPSKKQVIRERLRRSRTLTA